MSPACPQQPSPGAKQLLPTLRHCSARSAPPNPAAATLTLMPVHPGHGTAAAPKDKALGTSPEKRKRNRGPARFFHFSPTGQVLSSIHSVAPQLRWIWRKQPAAGRAVEAQESWELGECFPQSPAPNSLRVSATVLTAPVFSTALARSPAGLHQELG